MSLLKYAVPAFALAVGSFCQIAVAQTSLFRQPGQNVRSAASAKDRTVSDPSAAIAAAATTPVTGKFVANFTIKLVTAVPSGYEVLCSLNAGTSDYNTTTGAVNNEISEAASTKATVSGSTATCSVSIPYSWYLPDASSDIVALSYQLYILSASATSEAGVSRISEGCIPGACSVKVPASGATTTYSISATL